MIQKKVCMLGSFAVGKTSLVRRFVDNSFTENYTTTIGVKIDKKKVTINNIEMSLILWDVYGEDGYQSVLPAYLRGMAGYLLVVDPTRPGTFKSALSLNELVKKTLGEKPYILVMNKCDLKNQWNIDSPELKESIQKLSNTAAATIETSAKAETGVNEMFDLLAKSLLPASES